MSIFLFLFPAMLFANEQISPTLSSSEITMDDMLTLEIEVSDIRQISDIQVPGIENFYIFSQSQQSRYQSINGEMSSQNIYLYQLQAKEEGDFNLGPIRLESSGDIIQDDEILSIKVGEEDQGASSQKQVSQENSSSGLGDKTETNQEQETNMQTQERSKEFQDLKDIQRESLPVWFWLLCFLIFLSIFYLILKLALQENKAQKSAPEGILETKKDNLMDEFKSLRNQIDSLSDDGFYSLLQSLLRKVLSESSSLDVSSFTLQEILAQKDVENHLLISRLQQVYEYEYRQTQLSSSQKRELLDSIIHDYSQLG